MSGFQNIRVRNAQFERNIESCWRSSFPCAIGQPTTNQKVSEEKKGDRIWIVPPILCPSAIKINPYTFCIRRDRSNLIIHVIDHSSGNPPRPTNRSLSIWRLKRPSNMSFLNVKSSSPLRLAAWLEVRNVKWSGSATQSSQHACYDTTNILLSVFGSFTNLHILEISGCSKENPRKNYTYSYIYYLIMVETRQKWV